MADAWGQIGQALQQQQAKQVQANHQAQQIAQQQAMMQQQMANQQNQMQQQQKAKMHQQMQNANQMNMQGQDAADQYLINGDLQSAFNAFMYQLGQKAGGKYGQKGSEYAQSPEVPEKSSLSLDNLGQFFTMGDDGKISMTQDPELQKQLQGILQPVMMGQKPAEGGDTISLTGLAQKQGKTNDQALSMGQDPGNIGQMKSKMGGMI